MKVLFFVLHVQDFYSRSEKLVYLFYCPTLLAYMYMYTAINFQPVHERYRTCKVQSDNSNDITVKCRWFYHGYYNYYKSLVTA